MYYALIIILAILCAGGMACSVIALWAAWQFHRASSRPPAHRDFLPHVCLLKPLSGMETGLERNIESFFAQDYPSFEIIFAVKESSEPARVVHRLRAKYPQVAVRVIDASESCYANAKVYGLEKMAELASAEILIISDSDVFVTTDYLRRVVAPFADPRVGVSTCLYRGVPGRSLWSRLEALGMSTEFMAGVLLAWKMEGMKFALGPTMIVRRACLEAIGGFSAMADYLADDFVLGQWADREGYLVLLSPYVVNHQVLGEKLSASFQHRLRWARSSRFSRPWGYVGQVFTYPLPVALLLATLAWPSPIFLGVLLIALLLRGATALAVGWGILRDREALTSLWLVPLQDVFSFVVWCCGFTGRYVRWRDRSYRVWRHGRFEAVARHSAAMPEA